MNLAAKYRPRTFDDVIGQDITVEIIRRGIETGKFARATLFTGPAGTGKTTNARITAEMINNAPDSYIEIDAASNNSVDDIRELAETANERSVSFKYKIYIIDECHMLTTQAWNAMLKLIEEPSDYSMFIFCTTDPQKIPQTVLSRCQIFRFNRIGNSQITDRLKKICQSEQIRYTDSALEYIAKMSNGGMRQAITYLDKCKDYSDTVTIETATDVLGNCSYDIMFDLTNKVIDGDRAAIVAIIEELYQHGTDLKLFIAQYLDFVLQLSLHCLTGYSQIPESYKDQLAYATNIENNSQWFSAFTDKVLRIKNAMKNDNDMKTTMEVMLISRS